jgi:Transposase IS116/IS110/IS902 family./Transposase.
VSIVSRHYDHVIGVDTHSRTHTLVVLDASGALLASDTFPASGPGLARAHAWILRHAPGRVLVAMEGTGSYGATFCDLLIEEGIEVTETKPPKRGSRRAGKSDAIDAEHAARHVLCQPVERLLIPRTHGGDQAALRVLLTARRAKNMEKTATSNALIALLRSFSIGIDARQGLTGQQILQIAAWRPRPTDTAGIATIRAEATSMARNILQKKSELTANQTGLIKHVSALAPWLLAESGVGAFVAAQLLVSWSMKERIRSEAAFARLAGAAPVPASSGNTTRNRLHRGGDRQLNHALWVIASTRMLHDENTKTYTAKRTATGHSRRETLRNLKRYIARSLFRKLQATA